MKMFGSYCGIGALYRTQKRTQNREEDWNFSYVLPLSILTSDVSSCWVLLSCREATDMVESLEEPHRFKRVCSGLLRKTRRSLMEPWWWLYANNATPCKSHFLIKKSSPPALEIAKQPEQISHRQPPWCTILSWQLNNQQKTDRRRDRLRRWFVHRWSFQSVARLPKLLRHSKTS